MSLIHTHTHTHTHTNTHTHAYIISMKAQCFTVVLTHLRINMDSFESKQMRMHIRTCVIQLIFNNSFVSIILNLTQINFICKWDIWKISITFICRSFLTTCCCSLFFSLRLCHAIQNLWLKFWIKFFIRHAYIDTVKLLMTSTQVIVEKLAQNLAQGL